VNSSLCGTTVSVIVPVYNIQDQLPRCVESILSQTYEDLEILLVDDGSSDGSGELCDRYAARDPRVQAVHKENGGLSDARNCGIDRCTGEYIVFIDGDDYVRPDYVARLLESVTASGAGAALCGFDLVDEDGSIIRTEALTELSGTVSGRDVLSAVLTPYGYKYVVAWNKIYHRSLFERLRYDKGKIFEDEYIHFRLFSDCGSVSILSRPLYCYVQREGSITNSAMSAEKIEMKCEMHRRRIAFYRDAGDSELHSRASQMYCNWLVECVRRHSASLDRAAVAAYRDELRLHAPAASASPHTGRALRLQNRLGRCSLRAAARFKSIYIKLTGRKE